MRAERLAIEQAVRRNAFSRAFKRTVTAPADLADLTERALVRQCLDLLGIARRAGAIAFGYQACVDAIRRSRPYWHIEAKDGAPHDRLALLRMAAHLQPPPAPVCGCFAGSEIGMALGRGDVVHAVLLQEGLAQRWSAEMGRLAGFRAITPPEWT